ncbi:MAG TPA: hypothetical protein VE956_12105 [Nodularia sp. (in: cyanobacteria)]|nr:hypothetical protein [Nodularia sp. (in: cyanobacteria)]
MAWKLEVSKVDMHLSVLYLIAPSYLVRIFQYQKTPTTEELFKNMRGKVKYFEDLTTPTTEEWQEV